MSDGKICFGRTSAIIASPKLSLCNKCSKMTRVDTSTVTLKDKVYFVSSTIESEGLVYPNRGGGVSVYCSESCAKGHNHRFNKSPERYKNPYLHKKEAEIYLSLNRPTKTINYMCQLRIDNGYNPFFLTSKLDCFAERLYMMVRKVKRVIRSENLQKKQK